MKSKITYLDEHFNITAISSVLYISKNSPELIFWISAFSSLNIPISGIDYSLSDSVILDLISKVKPTILLVSKDLYEKISQKLLSNKVEKVILLDEFLYNKLGNIDIILKKVNTENFRSISFSSGTTSNPKVILRYSSFDKRRFDWFINKFKFNENDKFIVMLPLYHAAGNGWARLFMGLGCTIYLPDYDNEESIFNILKKYNITSTALTPISLERMINVMIKYNIESSFEWILVGGSHLFSSLKKKGLSILGDVIYEYYGCTETGVNVLAGPSDFINKPFSSGKVIDGNHMLVLDENNISVKNGIPGRIAISSYMLMDEYMDINSDFIFIDNKKYFLMSDMGYIDSDGYLFLLNRNQERDKSNVYCCLDEIKIIPEVKDVCIIKEGDSFLCIYSLFLDKEDKIINLKIKSILDKNFDYYKMKRVNDIPYSPSGKVRFNEIIKMF